MEVAAEGLSRRHGFSRLTTNRHLDAGRVHELRASSTKPIDFSRMFACTDTISV
jgi:hypothetical protein